MTASDLIGEDAGRELGAPSNRPPLSREFSAEVHRVDHRYLWRIILFLGLYFCSAWLSLELYQSLEADWGPALALLAGLPLYILSGASLHGISLFTHEGVHGVLHPNKAINHLLAAVCAWPVLQNFAAYRVLHLDHHKNLGAAGDPDHYENYAARRRMIYAMHWGRLLLGYPAYILAIPVLGFQQGSRRDRFFIVLELLAVAAMVAAAVSLIPAALLIHGWLLPMLMINTMVNIRGMSQHTLLEQASDVIKGTRSILTNPVTTFFMCNENYHLEHHLYPGVPWYHLPRLHEEIRSSLEAQGAPFVPSYWAFVREFVVSTLFWQPVGTVTPMRSELASR